MRFAAAQHVSLKIVSHYEYQQVNIRTADCVLGIHCADIDVTGTLFL